MLKKVFSVLLMCSFIIGLFACGKKTMMTNCKVCGERKKCYEIVLTKVNDKTYEETQYVCSKECEDYLCQLAVLAGGVKKR